MTVDPQPADRQYLLLDRIPGSEKLLVQSYFPTNLGMAAGGSLLLIDPQTEKIQPLGVDAPLPPAANLAWSPSQPSLLAFTAAGAQPGLSILTLFDFKTMNLMQPVPHGIQVNSLDWHPDGLRLAFAAEPIPGVTAAADLKTFPASGIYLYDTRSGKVNLTLHAPEGVSIGWVGWSADGKSLLYGRISRNAAGKTQGEVHAFALESQRDTILLNSIELSPGHLSPAVWQNILSYSR
jgi:dipeptidyl aminopeptidase/acylaminoacyl peptidase